MSIMSPEAPVIEEEQVTENIAEAALEEVVTEDEGVETPVEETEKDVEKTTEEEPEDEDIYSLLNDLSSSTIKEVEKQPDEQPEEDPEPLPPAAFEPFTISREAWDAMQDDPSLMEKEMVKMQKKVFNSAVKEAIKRIIPIAQKQAAVVTAWGNAATEFKLANKDLAPAMKFVGSQASRLANEHPDWSPEKVYTTAGELTKKLIKVQVQKEKAKGQDKRPRFAKTPGSTRTTGNESKPDKKSQEMRNLLKWDEPQENNIQIIRSNHEYTK